MFILCKPFIFIFICMCYFGCVKVNINRYHAKETLPWRIPVKIELDTSSFKNNHKGYVKYEKKYREAEQKYDRWSWHIKKAFKAEEDSSAKEAFLRGSDVHLVIPGVKSDTFSIRNPAALNDYNIQKNCRDSAIKHYKEIQEFVQFELESDFIELGKDKGYIICRMHDLKMNLGSLSYFLIPTSIATGSLLNFIGYPLMSQSAKIELKFEILDPDRDSIAKYSAQGKGSAYCAMFWGYHMSAAGNPYLHYPVPRAACLKALQNAMKDFRQQILQDISLIKNRL